MVTVGSFQSSSTRANVIAEEVQIQGTFRTFNPETRAFIKEELERICGITRALGGDYELKYELDYPPTVNNPEIAEVMRQVARDLIGPENVIEVKPKTWSEDFAYLAQKVPGAFMFLGAEIEGDTRCHHSHNFDLDEAGFYIGTAILAETARRLIAHFNEKA